MSQGTHIEWSTSTWPIVAGCEFESPECTGCYALLDSWRMAHNPNPKISTVFQGVVKKTENGHLVWTGVVRELPERLGWPLRWKTPEKIFVCNLADLFHPAVRFDFVDEAHAVMMATGWHIYQVLTKHADRMCEYYSAPSRERQVLKAGHRLVERGVIPADAELEALWPLRHVHVGVTAGDQKRLSERMPYLLRAPVAKRFLSYEPAIGPIDVEPWLELWRCTNCRYSGGRDALATRKGILECPRCLHRHAACGLLDHVGLDQVIAGGESGKRARPAHPDWFRRVRDDCARAEVPFFFKQWGAWIPCETDVIPEPAPVGGRKVWPIDEVGVELSDNRGYEVIEAHGQEFVKVGKKVAGRMLDGRIHEGYPR